MIFRKKRGKGRNIILARISLFRPILMNLLSEFTKHIERALITLWRLGGNNVRNFAKHVEECRPREVARDNNLYGYKGAQEIKIG